MDWLDLALGFVFVVCTIEGIARGFARTAIDFIAMLAGVFCGLWFYPGLASVLRPSIQSKEMADGLAFFLIFGAIAAAGAVGGHLLSRLFKARQLGWLDRVLGGGFGVIRGVFFATVLVLLALAFAPKPLPQAVLESRLAPPLIDGAITLSSAAPEELRFGFRRACEDIQRVVPEQWKKTLARLRVRN